MSATSILRAVLSLPGHPVSGPKRRASRPQILRLPSPGRPPGHPAQPDILFLPSLRITCRLGPACRMRDDWGPGRQRRPGERVEHLARGRQAGRGGATPAGSEHLT